jgi:hypothetical protein
MVLSFDITLVAYELKCRVLMLSLEITVQKCVVPHAQLLTHSV